MIVGGYTLDLYCDDAGHARDARTGSKTFYGTFYGQSQRETMKMARKEGWAFQEHEGGKSCICPECVKRNKEKKT